MENNAAGKLTMKFSYLNLHIPNIIIGKIENFDTVESQGRLGR
jgi:hypothetical protein